MEGISARGAVRSLCQKAGRLQDMVDEHAIVIESKIVFFVLTHDRVSSRLSLKPNEFRHFLDIYDYQEI